MSRSRLEILELVQQNKLSLEEGMALIKALQTGASSEQAVNQSTETSSEVYYYGTEWVREESGGNSAGYSRTGHILLFDTDEEVARLLRASKSPGSGSVVLVKPGTGFRQLGGDAFEVCLTQREDYRRLFEELRNQNVFPGTIVHAWSKQEFSEDESSVQAQMEQGIYSLFHLTGALLGQKLPHQVELLFTHLAFARQASPLNAAVSGFGKTLQMENPSVVVRTVEVQISQDVLDAALRLQGANEEDVEIRYQGGQRFVKRLKQVDQASEATGALPLKENGVYLITGGVGGLGLIFAEHLATTYRAKLVLSGRSALQPQQESDIRQLEALGAQVRYIRADVSKREDVDALVAAAKQQFGAVHGILHAAGIVRDAFVMKKSMDEVEQVLAPKVYGTLHLDHATQTEPLDFFVLFSSMAGAYGNVGQSDYAYGNAFMDHFAARRTSLGHRGRTLAICWPLWKDGGMQVDEETIEWMKKNRGVVPLGRENGLRAMEFGLRTSASQLMVVELAQTGAESEMQASQANQPSESNQAARLGDREQELFQEKSREFFKGIFSKATKVPADQIDVREPLEAYGIDSMMIMAVNRELESHFGGLSKTLLYEYPTITELTDYFIEHQQSKLMDKIGWAAPAKQESAAPAPVMQPPVAPAPPAIASQPRFAPTPAAHSVADEDIAIIGLNGRFPQSDDLEEFWRNLVAGNDCITEIPSDRWNHSKYYHPDKDKIAKTYSKWGGFVRDVDKFDPLFFSISPMEAETLDPQERLFLEVVHHAVEDAGYTRKALNDSKVGVFVGVMYGHYQLLHTELDGHLFSPASSYASIANRISYCFNFQGPSMALDTMCSSSLTSIHLACESIRRGESHVAIAGGVNVTIHPIKYLHLSMKRFISSDGRCRTFGEGGDGYVPGEGVGAVVLKPLSKAIADGDHIYGIIKGVALNHGGKTNGYTVPNPKAQSTVISDVLKKTGVNPRTISYVEAHGTGTPLGDPIEISGLSKAFGEFTKDKQYCPIGSVKTNIGHLESAAGIAAVSKVLLQMKHKQLVPSLHSDQLNPNLNFADSPFYVQHELEPWKQPVIVVNGVEIKVPRRAGISSFGAGGSNAHVVLEEYEQPALAPERVEPRVFILSARKEDRLKEYAQRMIGFLEHNAEDTRLLDLSFTLQVGREELEERLAIVVSSLDELKQRLTDYVQGKTSIEGLYRGTVRKQKREESLLLEGREGQEFIKVILNDRKFTKLARIWVAGTNVDWSLLYQVQDDPKRISLPGYPFAKERYWVPEVEITVVGRGEQAKLHPLVHRNVSTLREQAYATVLDGHEFYLTDHVVNEQKILPGVCYLEMARAAGEMAGERRVARLRNVVWANPVVVNDSPSEVTINLQPNGERVEFVISSAAAGGERLVHSQGSIVLDDQPQFGAAYNPVDLDAVLERCTDVRSGQEWYEAFVSHGFQYGKTFQVVREVMGNGTEILSRLELPEELRAEFADYQLHPSLMDGALQTVGGLMVGGQGHSGKTFLPYALGEVEIVGPLSDVCYVYVVAQNSGNSAVKKFDIQLTDSSGRVLVMIKDYSAREIRQSGAGAPQANSAQGSDDSALLELLKQIENGTLNSDQAEKSMEDIYG